MNNLEDFIKNNRTAFDMKTPPPNIWAGIEEQLPNTNQQATIRKMTFWTWIKAAAVVLILLTVGGLGGAYWMSSYHSTQVSNNLRDVSPEYAELEQFYVHKINMQQKELKRYNHDIELNEDLAELDVMFNDLKQELQGAHHDEQIIHAMIEHYQTKVQILERVLERMQEAENLQKEFNNEIHM